MCEVRSGPSRQGWLGGAGTKPSGIGAGVGGEMWRRRWWGEARPGRRAPKREAVTSKTVPARGDLRRLLQRRAGASPLPSAPASGLLAQSFSLPPLPPARPSVPPTRSSSSGVTLPGGAMRRFAVARGSPRPRPRCSRLRPAPATLPRCPQRSRLEMARGAPRHLPAVSALVLRAAFHSSICSCSRALTPSAPVPTSSERPQALDWALGTSA